MDSSDSPSLAPPTPDARLAAAVAQIGELPVLDRTVQRVLALCRDEDSTTNDLVAALETDASFAANLLRFANSAHAARPVRVRTIRQAVTLAGRETVGRMAIEAATCRFLESAPGNGRASVGLMHVHASAVASCSVELAQRSGAAVEVAHLGGLLHDIGKLVMPLAFGEEQLDEIAGQAPAGPERIALERERLGCDHARAGAMLANASHVDGPVIEAILGHHDPLDEERPARRLRAGRQHRRRDADGDRSRPELLDSALGMLGLDATCSTTSPSSPGSWARARRPRRPTEGALTARIAALEEQAGTDELTGLANRRHWNRSRASGSRERAAR